MWPYIQICSIKQGSPKSSRFPGFLGPLWSFMELRSDTSDTTPGTICPGFGNSMPVLKESDFGSFTSARSLSRFGSASLIYGLCCLDRKVKLGPKVELAGVALEKPQMMESRAPDFVIFSENIRIFWIFDDI